MQVAIFPRQQQINDEIKYELRANGFVAVPETKYHYPYFTKEIKIVGDRDFNCLISSEVMPMSCLAFADPFDSRLELCFTIKTNNIAGYNLFKYYNPDLAEIITYIFFRESRIVCKDVKTVMQVIEDKIEMFEEARGNDTTILE